MNNNFIKSLLLHIKYPYTAAIIAIMWIGIAFIIAIQKGANAEILISVTAVCTLIIAYAGFSSPK